MQEKLIIKCPSCGQDFEPDEMVQAGDLICCVDCDEEFKVISLHPLEIKKMMDIPEVHSGNYNEDFFRDLAQDYDPDSEPEEGSEREAEDEEFSEI